VTRLLSEQAPNQAWVHNTFLWNWPSPAENYQSRGKRRLADPGRSAPRCSAHRGGLL